VQQPADASWLAQSGTLEFHIWHSRDKWEPDAQGSKSTDYSSSLAALEASVLNYPDYVVFDIDPYIYSGKEAAGAEPELNTIAFEKGKEVAFWLRELLQSMSLDAIVKTSGKTGLHVFVPIRRTIDFDAARHVSELVGRHLMRAHPKDITLDWSVPKRTGKIFMDYNMNVRGKTLNVAYSPRGEPGAPVSMPLTWDELANGSPARLQDLQRRERLAKTATAGRMRWRRSRISKCGRDGEGLATALAPLLIGSRTAAHLPQAAHNQYQARPIGGRMRTHYDVGPSTFCRQAGPGRDATTFVRPLADELREEKCRNHAVKSFSSRSPEPRGTRSRLARACAPAAFAQTRNPDRDAYFGETHVHTSWSLDAWLGGNRTDPGDAYKYFKGEPIKHPLGYDVKIDTPLDWAGVTDHSEYVGVISWRTIRAPRSANCPRHSR
jgi:DNA primase